MICPSYIVVVGSVGTVGVCTAPPPRSYRITDKNFIFGMNVHICRQYMYVKYLVILTCSFWLIWFINQRALYNHALSVVHWCHQWCLCTPPLATGFTTETSYLLHICTYVPPIHAHQILSDFNL